MLEATHLEAAHAVPDAMEEDDSGRVVPDSDQHMVPHAQQQQQEQPEAMREDPVKPVMRSVRLQDDVQGGAQGTPKALASTLVSCTLPQANMLTLIQPVVQPNSLCYALVSAAASASAAAARWNNTHSRGLDTSQAPKQDPLENPPAPVC